MSAHVPKLRRVWCWEVIVDPVPLPWSATADAVRVSSGVVPVFLCPFAGSPDKTALTCGLEALGSSHEQRSHNPLLVTSDKRFPKPLIRPLPFPELALRSLRRAVTISTPSRT